MGASLNIKFSPETFEKWRQHHTDKDATIEYQQKVIEHQRHRIAGFKAFIKKMKVHFKK